jgi:hypothetical protein
MRFVKFATILLPLAIALCVLLANARYALRTMGAFIVTRLTKRQPDMRAKMSDLAANVWSMERINKDNDQELADYYASLVDDREENE